MSANYPIKRLKIEGFKSIREMDLELGDLNVLIGANGSGKSNFISFIDMMINYSNGRLQYWSKIQGGAEFFFHFGTSVTKNIKNIVEFGGASLNILLHSTENNEVFSEEIMQINTDSEFWIKSDDNMEIFIYKNKVLKKDIKEFLNKNINIIMDGWSVYHFHDTGSTSKIKRLGAVQDNYYFRPDASNLAAFLYRLKIETPDTYSQIVKTIQLAIPFFDDFDLRPEELPSGQRQIELLWRQRNSDYPFHPSQLSDGSLRFICLVTALLQPDPPSTIIIDEPELGLHPYAITLLAALLQSASARMQVIVATQSMALVNEFEVKDLIVVDRVDECSVFKRLDEAEFKSWREDYSTGELWEKNIFGGIPRR